MGKHWVKAKQTINRTNANGLLETLHAGDWFEVKNMELKMLLAQGKIERVENLDTVFDLSDCGVMVSTGDITQAREWVARSYRDMPVESGDILTYPRTLLWDARTKLRLDLMPVGFHRLTTGWQIAAPLFSYGKLARDIGTDDDRRRTEEVIRDLRVPVYETGLLYIRRCTDTEKLMEVWRNERNGGGDTRLAFMRALYRVKPIVNALPTTWTQ